MHCEMSTGSVTPTESDKSCSYNRERKRCARNPCHPKHLKCAVIVNEMDIHLVNIDFKTS